MIVPQQLQNVLDKLDKVRLAGDGKYLACCPAHADKNPSLSIALGDGDKLLFHCHAGCSYGSIAAALGVNHNHAPNGNGRAYRPKPKRAEPPAKDWAMLLKTLQAAMTDDRLGKLAETTGVPVAAWAKLSPGWADKETLKAMRAGGAGWADAPPDGAWAIAEHDGDGRTIGLTLRAEDGRKGAPAGGKRGVVVPTNLHQLPDPVLIVEGASDVAACCAMNLAAVGRPSNLGGAEQVADLLDGRAVLVVGERDGKPDGKWPGRDGAKAVAKQLAGRWGESVQWALTPPDTKDVRAWLTGKLAGGLNPTDADAMTAAGRELVEQLQQAAKTAKADKHTQADALVNIALRRYRLGMSDAGEPFALPVEGSAIVKMFRGGGSGLRADLSNAYRNLTGKTPSASALADALLALEGKAQDAEPEPLALRMARTPDGHIVLDLGDATGRAVVVTPTGWTVEDVSPVLFRRTALTATLAEPVEAVPADLLDLRRLLNVTDDSWPLVVGWMIAALAVDIGHPILLLDGIQGTGKTTAAKLIIGLIDPSGVSTRSEPRDAEQWAVAAAGSWAFCIDNISHISGWFSDAMCKAVTGDGSVRRKLYSDNDLAVLAFRRCIVLTSIDPGALRGDLGDRLLRLELEPIPDDKRRLESELLADYAAMTPKLLGAVLATAAKVLAALPSVKLDRYPRMADFAKVLAALDRSCPDLTGGRALDLYTDQSRRIVGDVIESDAVAVAIVAMMERQTQWSGTAGELLERITPDKPPKGWPVDALRLSGRLKRLRPALLAVGIRHTPPAKRDKRRVHLLEKGGDSTPTTPTTPKDGIITPQMGIFDGYKVGDGQGDNAQNGSANAHDAGVAPGVPGQRPSQRPNKTSELPLKNDALGVVGDEGDKNPHTSKPHVNADAPAKPAKPARIIEGVL